MSACRLRRSGLNGDGRCGAADDLAARVASAVTAYLGNVCTSVAAAAQEHHEVEATSMFWRVLRPRAPMFVAEK